MDLPLHMTLNIFSDWGISLPQLKHDVTHLFGLLKSAPKDFETSEVLDYNST